MEGFLAEVQVRKNLFIYLHVFKFSILIDSVNAVNYLYIFIVQ